MAQAIGHEQNKGIIMEKVNVLGGSPAEMVLFNAMTIVAGKNDIVQVFDLDKGSPVVNVEVKVNGVSVPFMQCLNTSIANAQDEESENIKQRAIDLLTESKLSDLYFAIQQAEWEIDKALNEVLKSS